MPRIMYVPLIILSCLDFAAAESQTALQQIPDLKSLPDRTLELQQEIDASGSLILQGAQHFRISSPLNFDLSKTGAMKFTATTGATLIMDGPGPAIRIIGSHQGTAAPQSFKPATWNERMPVVSNIEILGAHPEADGIQLKRTVGATITGVSVRWCRHGIHLVDRNRNVVVSNCHLYENSGIGVFLDDVDLHQINIASSHISYNRAGGVVVRDGNVRNIQISGCDIEANMPGDETKTATANVLLDLSGSSEDKTKSIAEVSITGCTLQHSANYSGSEDRTVARGGANIRVVGKEIYPIDSVTITGNVLSDTTHNVDINYALDVVISANTFFAPKPANLTVANSRRIVVNGNTFNPRQFVRPGTIRFTNTHDSVFAASTLHSLAAKDGSVILDGCTGFLLNALNFSDCGSGLLLQRCSNVSISGCRTSRTASGGVDLSADSSNRGLTLLGNSLSGTVVVSEIAKK
jgi:hypothetical protein